MHSDKDNELDRASSQNRSEGAEPKNQPERASSQNRSGRRRRKARRISPVDYDRTGESSLSSVVHALNQAEGRHHLGLGDDRMAGSDAESESGEDSAEIAGSPAGTVGAGEYAKTEAASQESPGNLPESFWRENEPPHWGYHYRR